MEGDPDGLSPLFLAPLNAHVPSDVEIWAMLRLPPPVRESFSKELDIPRHGLLTRLTQLASAVIGSALWSWRWAATELWTGWSSRRRSVP